MSPYLTHRGRWLLANGVLFLVLGALFSSPLILFLGEIQVALLAVSLMLLVPGALALDRRRVSISIEEARSTSPQALTTLVGEPLTFQAPGPLRAPSITACACFSV